MKKGSNPPPFSVSVLVVAGEVSGDQLGASIFNEMSYRKKYSFFGCGGSKMRAIGIELLFDIKQMEVIGLTEILRKYFKLRSYLKKLIKEAVQRGVRDAILIDYPGFNLLLAKKLSEHNIKSHMIVSPQIWAWKYGRIANIKKYISNMLCLYPFEVEIYKKENVKAHFIGHPIAHIIAEKKKQLRKELENDKPLDEKETIYFSLLPGSRKKEVIRLLPFLLLLAKKLPTEIPYPVKFLLPISKDKELLNIAKTLISKADCKNVKIMPGGVHDALFVSQVALACSGTVTLECMLFGVPFALLYKTSWLSYRLLKPFIRIPYLGIVNFIAQRQVHKEYIQKDITIPKVLPEVKRLLTDHTYVNNMQNTFKEIRRDLSAQKSSEKAATILSLEI